jgi:hypothetical protein
MIIEQRESTIVRGGVEAEQSFNIKADGRAFEILSSGIYTDPILAIIRELCCNARDAHVALDVANGVTNVAAAVPFLVHLPNASEPYFEVTDYGIGMSEHNIYKIFTTFFESTKDDSNDFIGALGLGSKSPLSYSDSFQVVSTWEGKKTSYSVFLNEQRIPSIAKLAEFNTIQPNGLAVRLSIKAQDFRDFERKTSNILKYFPTLPEVIGGSGHFAFEKLPDDPICGDGWFVDVTTNVYGSNFTAVMGGVPYKVDLSHLRDIIDSNMEEFLGNAKIVAYYELGDLNIPPSREEIRYDDKSKKRLAETVRTIQADIHNRIEERVAQIDDSSDWNAFQDIHKLSNEAFGYAGITRLVKRADITNPLLQRFMDQNGKFHIDASEWKSHTLRKYRAPNYASSVLGRPDVDVNQVITPSDRTAVVVLDMEAGGIKRIFEWWKAHTYNHMIAIRTENMKDVTPAEQAELADIIDSMGNPDVVRVSDMPTPPKKTTAKRASVTVTFLRFAGMTGGYSGNQRRVFDQIPDADAPTEGLYYLCARGCTPHFGTNTNSKRVDWRGEFSDNIAAMVKMINLSKGTSYTVDDVYGVNGPQCRKTISKDPKWVNIFELAAECFDVFKDAVLVKRRRDITTDFMGLTRDAYRDESQKLFATLHVDSPFLKMFVEMQDDRKRVDSLLPFVDNVIQIDRALNGYGDSAFKMDEETKEYFNEKEIFSMYPMLSFANGSYYNKTSRLETLATAFDYINLIDGNTP